MKKIDLLHLPSIPLHQKQNLPNTSGIYFVRQFDEVLYVGKSINIRKRWAEHHKHSELSLIEGVEISWLEYSLEELDDAEKYYISEFNPPLNYSKKWIEVEPVVFPPRYPLEIWLILAVGVIGIVAGESIVSTSNLIGETFNGFVVRLLLTLGGVFVSFWGGFHYGVRKYNKYLLSLTETQTNKDKGN